MSFIALNKQLNKKFLNYGKPLFGFFVCFGALIVLINNVSLLTLCSGVCLFLFAMMLLQESFKVLSGGVLDVFLEKVANTNYKSFLFGFTVSSLVQSSGLATVIAISFLSAGLMALQSGIAMVYGINLSTAGSAWLVGYFGLKTKISLYAMPLLIFGMVFFISKNKKVKGAGLFLLSLGLLFLGISYMKEGFENFKDTFDISQFQMDGFLGLLLYCLIGFGVTVITQSSHATLTLALAALAVGQVSYENAIGVAIGANVGSTIMAVIGSLNSNIEGKKITVTHVFFNCFAALMAIVFFKLYLIAVDYLSAWVGIAEDDYVLKLAMFTTLFNVIGVVVLYPFIPQMQKFLNKYVREKEKDNQEAKPLFLSDEVLQFSDSALTSLTLESVRLLQKALSMIARVVSLKEEDIASEDDIKSVVSSRNKPTEFNFEDAYQQEFKVLYSTIVEFAVRAGYEASTAEKNTIFMDIRRANLYIAQAVKEASQLQTNINKFGFSNNGYIRAEYSHMRRNLLRLLRQVYSVSQATTIEEIDNIMKEILANSEKFDAVSSTSLDTLIRNHYISDSVATSIMNDNALSRTLARNLYEVIDLLFRKNPVAIEE